jgi:hypothetical protein
MQCHNLTDNGFFLAQSYFVPAKTQEEDNIQEQVPEHSIRYREENKDFLPGERLLIQIDKERRKKKKINKEIDVNKIIDSISRITMNLTH